MIETPTPIGYVVRVSGADVVINLATDVQSRVYGHPGGITRLGKPGDLVGVASSGSIIVMEISNTAFVDPAAAAKTQRGDVDDTPLQQFICRAIGFIRVHSGALEFSPGIEELPFLGAEVIPLGDEELSCIMQPCVKSGRALYLGKDANDRLRSINVDVDSLLERHAAVVGSTGQGKTHFTINVIKQLADMPRSRIIVFDVNGEYEAAFSGVSTAKVTKIGASSGGIRIPYPALGQAGLFRLLLPSERAQAPALRFAIESLPFLESAGSGAHAVGQAQDVLFDDCRQGNAELAKQTIDNLRTGGYAMASRWPHFNSIGCVVADAYSIEPARGPFPYQRSTFLYGHVSSLIQRVRITSADRRFRDIIDVYPDATEAALSLDSAAARFLDEIFGPRETPTDWRIHIVDLSSVAPDLLHFVVDALLEQLANDAFERGPGKSFPMLLVLEEAHHYIRAQAEGVVFADTPLAHERLAKEGRKFGISLFLCTQRPSELSSTVLSQCGSAFAFRLINQDDRRIVEAIAGPDVSAFTDLAALSQGHMIATGAALNFPVRIVGEKAVPAPGAHDGGFVKAWSAS